MAKNLRSLSDDFYEIIANEEQKNPPKQKVPDVIHLQRIGEIREIVDHYKKVHPDSKEIKSSSSSWKLIDKRLVDGYTVKELTLAIDNNCNPDLFDWWCNECRHAIKDIMGKENNLDTFINKKMRGKNGSTGYSPGSDSFSGSTDGFGK
tara:strand:- start:916 stop:1362 length:447 start_codon:yes stop_codon:yes gene_type:complete